MADHTLASLSSKAPKLPFDVFQVLAMVLPGLLVILLWPSGILGRFHVDETIAAQLRSSAKDWLAYPVLLVSSLIVGGGVDTVGTGIRNWMLHRGAVTAALQIGATERFRKYVLKAIEFSPRG